MKSFSIENLSEQEVQQLLKRPNMDFSTVFGIVAPIIEEVRINGDSAVKAFTKKFEQVELQSTVLNPGDVQISLSEEIKDAIDTAFDNIAAFHEAQLASPIEMETMPGVHCKKITRPIERVGLYIPGGTAVLPSTAMMLSIPAMIAGCNTIVLATPPKPDGTIAPEIIYIAQKAGVDSILLAGGAQAVAALAYGTESVPKVDKILGPGNQYVTAAKMLLQNSEAQISIDMPAGPSEVLVIADESANPSYVAADLLSQAEHGEDSQVVLVAVKGFNEAELEKELEVQVNQLPRKEIAQRALENSYSISVPDIEQATSFSNLYAPEHLIVNVENAEDYEQLITNAGSVFLGQLTPESVGDYASGTNHTLPTYGFARMYSGVNLASFQKSITVQNLTEQGLLNVGPSVEVLAELEELQAHKNAVSIRLKDIRES